MTQRIARHQRINSPVTPLAYSPHSSTSRNKRYEYTYFINPDQQNIKPQPKSNTPKNEKIPIDLNVQKQPKTKEASAQPINNQTQSKVINKRINRIKNFSSFRNLELDPRDQKVRISFNSQHYAEIIKNNSETPMEPFQDDLRDWLVDLIQITTSIGFNHLNKETLSQKQTKNFVAKNILEHIKQFFENHKEFSLETRLKLMTFINEQSYQIFDHIAKKYPQTRSKGVSKRIKSRVPVIDNRQNNEFDFLLRNQMQIHYRDDGDYSEDIMLIINKLISFSNEPYNPSMQLEDSNYQIFSQMMETLFENSIYQSAEVTTNRIAKLVCSKKNNVSMKECSQISNNQDNQTDTEQKSLDSKVLSRMRDFQKQVIIGHKIPIGVPLFPQEDIESSKFKIHDSSVLRLLTKWSEELRNIIVNAEDTIYRRRFKFKNNKGKLISLEPQMKTHLYKAAIHEIQQIQKDLKYLKTQNFLLQTIFAEEQNIGKYSKNDTKVGIYAAQLNQISSQYIFKYLNKLIHSLLTIPRVAAKSSSSDRQKAVIESVNLVTFKLGDMMRCKCSCSQHQFLKILSTVDSIHLNYPDILKIVRIKNRLETQNNDILINFFFGNKAECQLQLSVLSMDKKDEKNSSKFSHLIYEIVRAELGPVSEMASIVVQYDPLAYHYSKKQNYGPELIKSKNVIIKPGEPYPKNLQQRVQLRSKKNLGSNIELPFVCCTCSKLAIVHNPLFYYRNLSIPLRQCNDCLSTSFTVGNPDRLTLKKHLLDTNFSNDKNMRNFYQKHLKLWDAKKFIEELKKQTEEQISSMWFPSRGFAVRHHQKQQKVELFTSIFEPTFSYQVFAHKKQNGEKKMIFGIKIHEEKDKKIKNIQKQLKKYVLLYFLDIKDVDEDGVKYFACNRADCCGLKINPGPVMQRKQIGQYLDYKMIDSSIQSQRNMLYFNFMPQSLEKLKTYLDDIKQRNKLWKIRNTVQSIESFECNISCVKVVGMFIKLTDLNVANNPLLTSLQGLKTCEQLKYLNCTNCDLDDISQLAALQKIETVNLTNNKRLKSIQSLRSHLDLQELLLANTGVQSLSPLENCLKLQSLDLQGCKQLTSIKQIKSLQLSYISIINCTCIDTFDLPSPTIKSLKTIQLTKSQPHRQLIESIMAISKVQHQNKVVRTQQQPIDKRAIHQINKLLKIRRTTSITLE